MLNLQQDYLEQLDMPSAWYIEGYIDGCRGKTERPPQTYGQDVIEAYKLGYEDGEGERSNRS